MIGIGVRASVENQVISEWTFRERSLGSEVQDEAIGIRLALCKTLKYHWTRISILVGNKRLLSCLLDGKPIEANLELLSEDIKDIAQLFQVCYFEYVKMTIRDQVSKLSLHALASIADEEWNFSGP